MARVEIAGSDRQQIMADLNAALKQNSLVQFIGNIDDDDGCWDYYKIPGVKNRLLRFTSQQTKNVNLKGQIFQGEQLPESNKAALHWDVTIFDYTSDTQALEKFYAILDTDFICMWGLLIIRMHKVYDQQDTTVKLITGENSINASNFGELATDDQRTITKSIQYGFSPNNLREIKLFALMDLFTQDAYTYQNGVYSQCNDNGNYGDDVPIDLTYGQLYLFTDIKTGQQYKVRYMGSCLVGGY